jgi:hypothetical protein
MIPEVYVIGAILLSVVVIASLCGSDSSDDV